MIKIFKEPVKYLRCRVAEEEVIDEVMQSQKMKSLRQRTFIKIPPNFLGRNISGGFGVTQDLIGLLAVGGVEMGEKSSRGGAQAILMDLSLSLITGKYYPTMFLFIYVMRLVWWRIFCIL